MHIEKNICDNIIGTLLDIQGKTKDHVNARYDLQDMGIRKNLHPWELDGGRVHMKSQFYVLFKVRQITGWDCIKYFKVCEC